jgi:HEAT repeat protein
MNPLEQFLNAVIEGNDARAERLSQQLQPVHAAALCERTHATDVNQRWWAVRGLAVCGDQPAVAAVVARLPDSDPAVRAVAARALAEMHRRLPVAVQPALWQIAPLLRDGDGLVRQSAADALALCGDAAVPVLEAVLAERHEGARTRAAQALGKIATMRAAPILYRHLDDANHLVRMHAHTALDEMGLLENMLLSL